MCVFGSQEYCTVSQINYYCSTFHGVPPSGRLECVCLHYLLSRKLVEVFVSYGVTITTCIHSFSFMDLQVWSDRDCQTHSRQAENS
jgi:hypothetical protein